MLSYIFTYWYPGVIFVCLNLVGVVVVLRWKNMNTITVLLAAAGFLCAALAQLLRILTLFLVNSASNIEPDTAALYLEWLIMVFWLSAPLLLVIAMFRIGRSNAT